MSTCIFVVSSAQPGCDGIGDHTRMLARYLRQRAIDARILAISDRHATLDSEEVQEDVPVTRFCFSTRYAQQTEKVTNYFKASSPEWALLHYVIYGFHPRGIPLGHDVLFAGVPSSIRRGIFFHETWLGLSTHATIKDRAIGAVQKRLIKRLMQRWKPELIQTSSQIYQDILRRSGMEAEYWPLFSNIVTAPRDPSLIEGLLKAHRIAVQPRHEWLLFAVFGSVYSGFTPGAVLAEAAQQTGKKVALLLIGRSIPYDLKALEADCKPWPVLPLGEFPQEQASQIMQEIDIAFGTMPQLWSEKSSTIASWRDMGVPVLIKDNDEQIFGKMTQLDATTADSFPFYTCSIPGWNWFPARFPVHQSIMQTGDRLLARLREVR